MDFKTLYAKYKEGVCTEEEKQFVEAEMEKARLVNEEILNSFENPEKIELKPADEEKILIAKKKFNTKQLIKTIIVSLSVMLALSAISLCTIFGFAIGNAKKNQKYSMEEAQTTVIDFAFDYAVENLNYTGTKQAIRLGDKIDKDLEVRFPFSKCHYVFDVELFVGAIQLEIEFNSQSGICTLTDIDR